MHALIIEDESIIAITIEEVLTSYGFTSFDIAWSEEEAVRVAALRRPALITADGQLRPGSGIDAVNAICSHGSIPVIFITATPAEVERRMPDHPLVVKPFSNEAIVSALNLAMSNSHQPRC